jgi:hypothetical protein
MTELQHVDPGQVEMIIGSLAGPLCAGGGFCAGSKEVIDHQRISSAAYNFSAALPAILATTASETVRMLHDSPEMGMSLRENIKTLRSQLEGRSEWVECQSVVENPVQLLVFTDEVVESRELDDEDQDSLIQEIVDEVFTVLFWFRNYVTNSSSTGFSEWCSCYKTQGYAKNIRSKCSRSAMATKTGFEGLRHYGINQEGDGKGRNSIETCY